MRVNSGSSTSRRRILARSCTRYQAVGIVARVESSRALDCVRECRAALTLWCRKIAVRHFFHRPHSQHGLRPDPQAV